MTPTAIHKKPKGKIKINNGFGLGFNINKKNKKINIDGNIVNINKRAKIALKCTILWNK